jgi:hypothetical protein
VFTAVVIFSTAAVLTRFVAATIDVFLDDDFLDDVLVRECERVRERVRACVLEFVILRFKVRVNVLCSIYLYNIML